MCGEDIREKKSGNLHWTPARSITQHERVQQGNGRTVYHNEREKNFLIKRATKHVDRCRTLPLAHDMQFVRNVIQQYPEVQQ